MGKWSTINYPANFDALRDELKALPAAEIEKLWELYGCRTIQEYGLNWYWSQMNDWSCLDNSTGESTFKLGFVYRVCQNDGLRSAAEKLAVVLAHKVGIKPIEVKPEVDDTVQEQGTPDACSFAASIILGAVNQAKQQECAPPSKTYNDPSNPNFAQDFNKAYTLAKKVAGFGLNYEEASGLWSAEIVTDHDRYVTKHHPLSFALELAIQYLERL